MDEDSIDNELFYTIMFRNQGPDAGLANPGEAPDEKTPMTTMNVCEAHLLKSAKVKQQTL